MSLIACRRARPTSRSSEALTLLREFSRSTSASASGMPGVLGVLTGDDWTAAGFGKLPCIWQVDSRDGSAMNEAPRQALAPLADGRGRVRHVGEIVAAVIAASASEAVDAAEAVNVDYEPLVPVIETASALAPRRPSSTRTSARICALTSSSGTATRSRGRSSVRIT